MLRKPINHLFIIATTLFLALLSTVVAYATPQNAISSVTSTVNIDTDGEISIIYRNVAHPAIVEKVVIKTYIEKKTFFSWERINIGTINNEWIDTINHGIYTGSRSYPLSIPGIYRTTIIYLFYDSNGFLISTKFQLEDTFVNKR